MRRPGLGVFLLVGFASLAVTGCGGNGSLPLTARLIGHGGFPGYTPGTQSSYPSPQAWVAAGAPSLTLDQRKAEIARLTHEGFKGDVTEFLDGPQGPRTGVSAAMQLGSAAAARAELKAELASLAFQGRIEKRFRVPAIRGAVGYGSTSPRGGGENILFADGSFVYLVGYGWYGTARYPRHAALVKAAADLYRKVHGHPAG